MRSWGRLLMLLGLLLGAGLVVAGVLQGTRQQHVARKAVASPSPLVDPSLFPRGVNQVVPPAGLRIRVVDLGIDLPVVAGDGWDAPFYKAATYPGLALPGQGARSVIYAHARAGMFGPLFSGKVGQRVDIVEPEGAALHYVVREYYGHWPTTDLKWLQPLQQEQLVLVTCTTYNPNDPRIVVVAEPV